MSDLTEFLAAQLDEDEAYARQGWESFGAGDLPDMALRQITAARAILAAYRTVLAECATMLRASRPRKYGEHDGLREAVVQLAAIYSDHPDYRQEWRP